MDEITEAMNDKLKATNSFTRQYMEQLKRRLNIESDYALAKHLKVSKTTVSNYKNGYSAFSPAVCHRVAEILEIEPGIVVAATEVDRHSGSSQKEIDTWKWIMQATKQAAGYAHVALLLVVASISFTAAPNAEAAVLSPASDKVSSVYYVKKRLGQLFRALRRALADRIGGFFGGNHVQSAHTDAAFPYPA